MGHWRRARLLEPRVMLDAAALVSFVDTADVDHDTSFQESDATDLTSQHVTDILSDAEGTLPAAMKGDQQDPDPVLLDGALDETRGSVLIFFDALLDGLQELKTGLDKDVVVTVIGPSQDGAEVMSQVIAETGQVSEIHVFAHGAAGQFTLGETVFSSETLAEHHRDMIDAWTRSMDQGADILLYSCSLAEDDSGMLFVNKMAALTGGDVAASTDPTGSPDQGGNWDLEYATGSIEAVNPIDAEVLAAFGHLLDNTPPTASDQSADLNEDATKNFDGETFGFADDDPGDTFAGIKIITPPDVSDGDLTFNGSAVTANQEIAHDQLDNLVFTPVNKTDSYDANFTFQVKDSSGDYSASTYTYTLNVTADNAAPTAVGDAVSVTEDTSTTADGNVLDNDTDPDTDDTKTVTVVRLGGAAGAGNPGTLGSALKGDHGSLTLNADGSYTYNLDNESEAVQSLGVDETLTDAFNYTMEDSGGNSASAAITVTIDGTNDAPVATPTNLVVTTPVPENATEAENPGILVSSLLKTVTGVSLVTDVDSSDTTPGIAVYDSSTTNEMTGAWQYKLDGSETWVDFTPSETEATLIPHDAVVRFVADDRPGDDAKESGEATLNYYAWDGNLHNPGDTTDVSDGNRGGNTAISEDAINATIQISARNDDPVLTQGTITVPETGSVTLTANADPHVIGTEMIRLLDPDNTAEQILYRVEALPENGSLTKDGIAMRVGTLFSHEELADGKIEYSYTGDELSSDTTDSFRVSVRDGAGGVIGADGATGDNPWATITLDIQDVNAQIAISGTSQTVPEAVNGVPAYTEINLNMSDADGDPALMTLTINSLPDPAVGKLQYYNGSDWVDVTVGLVLTKNELNDNPLRFIHTGVEPKDTPWYTGTAYPTATFDVTATDGHETLTPTTDSDTVTLTILPRNDPPVPVTDTLTVTEGAPNPTIDTDYLDATDPDSDPAKRVYTVSSNPAHGSLYLNGVLIGVGSTFTQADLTNNNLTFRPTGGTYTDSTDDSFNFRVNDSDGGVASGTLPITIEAGTYGDDVGPGGTLEAVTPEGLFTALDSTTLKGSDSYTLTALPTYGTLYLNGVELNVDDTFTQANINNGDVVYVHDGTEPNGHTTPYQDSFTVDRTGGTVSGSSALELTITPVNDAPIITQTTGTISTNQDGDDLMEHNTDGGDANTFALTDVSNAVKLTNDHLQDNDPDTGEGQLFYVLEQSPGSDGSIRRWDGSSWNTIPEGGQFAVADVEDGNIAYFHNPDSENRSVTIKVHLIDGGVLEAGDVEISGGSITEKGFVTVDDGQTTPITINKGDVAKSPTREIIFEVTNVNDPPVASDGSFTVEEGYPSVSGEPDDNPGRIQVLDATILGAGDSDNPLSGADYYIKSLPEHGTIEVDTNNDGTFDKVLDDPDITGDGYQFTKAQLDAGRLRYVQDGSHNTSDSFTWGLNDNATDAPSDQDSNVATVSINIIPMNNPPVVYNNDPITLDEGQVGVTITTDYLGSETDDNIDPDNSPSQVQYRITECVQYGTLYLDKTDDGGGITILCKGAAFTLADIQAGYLKYTHDGSEPHEHGRPFEDGFDFKISDASGMDEPEARFVIQVDPVNDAPTLAPSFFGAASYVEDSDPVAVGSKVVFSDPDLNGPGATPNLDGGTLEVTISTETIEADDVLSVIATGGITVDGNDVKYDGTTIGTIDGTNNGSGGNSLLITFNEDVTSDAAVQALIRAIGFSNSDTANPTEGQRDLTIVYKDGNPESGGEHDQESVTGTGTVMVSQVNDRPVLARHTGGGNLELATITEDDADSSHQVSSFLDASAANDKTGIEDVDDGSVMGIAVTGLTNAATGKWQYFTDNEATWKDVGAVSDTSALLLRPQDHIRFVPDGENGGDATFTYKAWDQTAGNFGAKADSTANDTQTSAFSEDTDTAQITVTDVNDAPVLTDAGSVTTDEDTTSTPVTLESLVTVTDVDTGSSLSGLAIVGNTADSVTEGVWQYSTDGTNWADIGTVEDGANALALSEDTQVRFVPAPDYNGTPPGLTVRALDESYDAGFSSFDGTAETRVTVDTTSTGGITAISADSETIGITVNPVNDAPTITATTTDFSAAVTENDSIDLPGISVDDVEADRNEGSGDNQGKVLVTIAVDNPERLGTVAVTTSGSAEVSGSGGDTITIKGTLADVNATLASLSFTPGDDTNTSETVTATVNDLGNNGTGSTTALEASQVITISNITPVNDAPTASVPSSVSATEDVQFSFTGGNTLSIDDLDARDGTVEVDLSIPSGTLNVTLSGSASIHAGANNSGDIT
jgi:VCBS repeat-containing protein